MSDFKSAVVCMTAPGVIGIHTVAHSNHHAAIESAFGLPLNPDVNKVRIVFSPKDWETAGDPETYELKVVQPDLPEWWTEHVQGQVRTFMEKYIRSITIRDRRKAWLSGGEWLLVGEAHVDIIENAYMPVIAGTARLACALNCRIDNVTGQARIDDVVGTTHIQHVSGDAELGTVTDHARILVLSGRAKLSKLKGHASVQQTFATATIEEAAEHARIKDVAGDNTVLRLAGHAQIENLLGRSCVRRMADYSRIQVVHGQAKVMHMKDRSQIDWVKAPGSVGKEDRNTAVLKRS